MINWQVNLFEQLVSTNETAKDFPAYTVISAATQTGGKGRYGRRWESPAGNLYLSAVVPDYGNVAPMLAFAAGVAVADALSLWRPARLKWPNDVLIDGGKAAGLLLEKREDGCVIIGIGVNVISAPVEGMMYRTACLGPDVAVADVRKRVLAALAREVTGVAEEGFAPVRQKWLAKADGLNRRMRVNLPNGSVDGLFRGLSLSGELVLETPDGTVQYISAGDVFLMDKS